MTETEENVREYDQKRVLALIELFFDAIGSTKASGIESYKALRAVEETILANSAPDKLTRAKIRKILG